MEYEFAPNDPLLPYLVKADGVVVLDKLEIESPTLEFLKTVGIRLVVPLVSQGELIGLLNLGPRMSEQDYSSDDFRLLNTLATQAAPALRVAQLARQQQAEARERERIEQELRVARVIQQTLLPDELPQIENWQLDALWQPAREVSGDFYDFLEFPDGRYGIIIADVTGKGVPAALVMATTRSILRSVAERYINPGEVLERTNNQVCPDIPKNTFITCLYVLLDPVSGHLVYANAGHNLPEKCSQEGETELRATGMPLGLLPGMTYEEKETWLLPGESLLMYSDGLVEAHNPAGEMFGFPRLRSLIRASAHNSSASCSNHIQTLMDELNQFTGRSWEQEDDITFVMIRRMQESVSLPSLEFETLAQFSLPSVSGNERVAMERVAEIVSQAGFPAARLEKLKTAVAEATLNAMEHGNSFHEEIPAVICVRKSSQVFSILITDRGAGVPVTDWVQPDLEAKLAGLQSPRGWGLFLIRSMVDELNDTCTADAHTVELIFNRTSIQTGTTQIQEGDHES